LTRCFAPSRPTLAQFSTGINHKHVERSITTLEKNRGKPMAKLRATPKNLAEAEAALRGRESVRLGNNTFLEAVGARAIGFVGVRLHNTYIVRFWYDGKITLHTGGYRTVTTKDRINQFINGRVFQHDYSWFYDYPTTRTNITRTMEGEQRLRVPFEEGMEVSA
jgi:hypothetical protein